MRKCELLGEYVRYNNQIQCMKLGVSFRKTHFLRLSINNLNHYSHAKELVSPCTGIYKTYYHRNTQTISAGRCNFISN